MNPLCSFVRYWTEELTVDSNGIRFSISDLSPSTARVMPTLFQDRAGISLYDAQYSAGSKGPISDSIISAVISAFLRFQATCVDFGVPEANIKVLATEATRTAENSQDFRRRIQSATGWEVEMLAKEDEGRIGAMGVASSFSSVKGLVMDLGGGSTQITWMIAEGGTVTTSPRGSISFPYGAAALSRRLGEVVSKPVEKTKLAEEMRANFRAAYADLAIPDELSVMAKDQGGFCLYLSGGGFRGWGYLLMSQYASGQYPIPIINGFQVTKHDFENTLSISNVASTEKVFRVSNRRAAQVPAVAFLVSVLMDALPIVKEVRFCQGGVREGYLFNMLAVAVRADDPLPVAAAPYASSAAKQIAHLLDSALPKHGSKRDRNYPASLRPAVLLALSNLMFYHSNLPKETASAAALRAPVSGVLGSAHGISHVDRAMLGLMLCERWDGEVPPADQQMKDGLQGVLGDELVWWCNYMGKVAGLIGTVYPAGVIRDGAERLSLHASWAGSMGKKGHEEGVKLVLKAKNDDSMTTGDSWSPAVAELEKCGKRKNWIGGKEGWGLRLEVFIEDLR